MNTAEEEENQMPHQNNEEEAESIAVLSERSPIRLGLILGLLSVAVTFVGAAWYLASALTKIETKLDAIVVQVTTASSAAATIERRQGEHEREDQNMWRAIDTRVAIIERIGSPRIPELEKRINELENEMKVQQALRKP